ncbi:MAG: polyprenyl diphosphate synthase [Synergistaceae bacterium]|uniref:polyprenyl diphosphate synthase n=1 Tax=Aminivibrio sp. TaxID=1872489 RepID=UPI002A190012|nr:polyprenyl diphosphate synthase [Synergistaceae bacterium]MDD3390832.1 polyprenyl diphosphate synthase [Synergistaceae bacterium]MDD3688541.1 polyprenyl diphosphate synthase [Synergistaceae bacterium]MDD4020620.1 polyprenyl diphosphate synthase [Synergistaceae bacterium]MDD4611383.1 polyprenyl diphosphate synthase [Synergistaceae bacterium]
MPDNLPSPFHVALIMDGNGRWAKKRFLPRLLGHRAGIKALERTVRAAWNLGVTHLSVYAFSTENWSRPETEVKGLMSLFRFSLRRKVEEIQKENVRIRFAGTRSGMPSDVLELMDWAENATADNTGLTLIACLNYGGRREIMDAVNAILSEGRTGPVSEKEFAARLYLPDVPDPDLIIRTSGEQRLSNFWLWEGAYSELYFTQTLWPDFGPGDLEAAIEHFTGRERRYGSVR